MPAVIFKGNSVKTLKSTVDLNGQSIIISGTVNPSAVATDGTIGSLYLNSSNGNLYKKQDNGSTTNWQIMQVSSAAVALAVNTTVTAISSALTDVVFTNKVIDPTNSYNTSTGVWTCPTTGLYSIQGAVFCSGTFGLDTRVNCMIQVNGVDTAAALQRSGGAVTNMGSGVVIALRNITAGQTVKFRAASNATTPTINSDTTLTYLNINKIG